MSGKISANIRPGSPAALPGSPPGTLLCLVSDQRMMNLLPLYQRGLAFKRVVLLASEKDGQINPTFARICAEMQAGCSLPLEWALWPAAVDPMDPAAVQVECARVIRQYGGPEEVMLNFTGGTKLISIGAYNAGAALGAPLLYVDTAAEQMRFFHPGWPAACPFDFAPIPVGDILAAHGKPVDEEKTALKQPQPFEWALSALILTGRPGSLAAMLRLQEEFRAYQKQDPPARRVPLPADKWTAQILNGLAQAGAAVLDEAGCALHPAGARYLDGNWLEQYTLLALRAGQTADFREGQRFDLRGNLHVAGIENELDVALTLNGKLGIVECKSGKMAGKEAAGMLNRLRALKDSLAGRFGKAFLVTSHDTAALSTAFKARAEEYVSRIIGLEDLGRVEEIIFQEMAQRGR